MGNLAKVLFGIVLLGLIGLCAPLHAFEPRNPFGSACKVSRMDLEGGSLAELPYATDQGEIGNCYAHAATTVLSAQYARDGVATSGRPSPLHTALLYFAASSEAGWRAFEKVDKSAAITDGGYQDRAYQLAAKWGVCSATEIEGTIGTVGILSDTFKLTAPFKTPDTIRQRHFDRLRAATNLLVELAQEAMGAPDADRARKVSEMVRSWKALGLPERLLPDNSFISDLLNPRGMKGNPAAFAEAVLIERCKTGPRVRVENVTSLYRLPKDVVPASRTSLTRQMVPSDWDRIASKLNARKGLPITATVCANLFDSPETKHLEEEGSYCKAGDEHAVVLKGVAQCKANDRWYLVQNSWGRDWCPEAASKAKGVICDRDSSGRTTGSVWMSESTMQRGFYQFSIYGPQSDFGSEPRRDSLPRQSGAAN